MPDALALAPPHLPEHKVGIEESRLTSCSGHPCTISPSLTPAGAGARDTWRDQSQRHRTGGWGVTAVLCDLFGGKGPADTLYLISTMDLGSLVEPKVLESSEI